MLIRAQENREAGHLKKQPSKCQSPGNNYSSGEELWCTSNPLFFTALMSQERFYSSYGWNMARKDEIAAVKHSFLMPPQLEYATYNHSQGPTPIGCSLTHLPVVSASCLNHQERHATKHCREQNACYICGSFHLMPYDQYQRVYLSCGMQEMESFCNVWLITNLHLR